MKTQIEQIDEDIFQFFFRGMSLYPCHLQGPDRHVRLDGKEIYYIQ